MTLAATPNMGIQKPEPQVTTGPTWATMVNTMIDTVDAHDHSAGKGARITPAGLNINADLEINSNNLTEIRSVRLESQGAALATASDKRCVYALGDNLYYNNSSGAAVQITNGTAVNSTVTGAFAATTPGGFPYSVTGTDAQKVLLVDTNSARTINLPAATTAVLFCVKDKVGLAGTNNITIHPAGTDTVEGAAADYKLNKPYGWWFLISDGVSAWHVAEAAPDLIPAGSLQMFGGASAPAGWLLCQGQQISRTTYAKLFAAIGTSYGVGDGSSTFNIPDLRQKFPLGKAASGTGANLGDTGGAIDHTHSLPAHHHGMGTGADLAIGASGSHTHAIDHDHAAFNSGATAPTTDSQGSHYHKMVKDTLVTSGTMSDVPGLARSYDGSGSVYNYDLKTTNLTPDACRTSTDGAHTHTVNSHTHTVDVPAYTGASGAATHTHGSSDITGKIGLVTGGVDGNAAMTSGAQNPPFLTVNFIIKF